MRRAQEAVRLARNRVDELRPFGEHPRGGEKERLAAVEIEVVDAGQVVESGTHAELVARQGRYAQLLGEGAVAA